MFLSGSVTSGGIRMGHGSQQTITEDDAAAIQREIPAVQVAAPATRGTAQVVYGNLNWSTVIQGVTPEYVEARDWPLEAGRGFNPEEVDAEAKVALMGQTTAQNLFGDLSKTHMLLIGVGVALIAKFHWLLYVFGVFLIYAGIRTFRERKEHPDVSHSPIFQRIQRVLPTTADYHGDQFFVRKNGRLLATPMFVVLLLVEFTDLIFAMDSIPAIFAITRDPFIVLTSNVFAILGLRALYFLLAGVADRLRYLKTGLAIILVYVGVKLFTENVEGIYHPTPLQSLAVIAAVLTVTVLASLRAVPPEDGVPPSGIGPFGKPARRHQPPANGQGDRPASPR